jgi:hypothetical protein
MAWPPPYTGLIAHDGTPLSSAAGGGGYPPANWPSRDQLDYTIKAVTALILVLALPWVAFKLMTNPSAVLAGAGRTAIKGNL